MSDTSPRYHHGSYVITSVMEINHQGSWVKLWGEGGFWTVFITHEDNRPAQREDVLLNVKLRESPVYKEKHQGVARMYQWTHAH